MDVNLGYITSELLISDRCFLLLPVCMPGLLLDTLYKCSIFGWGLVDQAQLGRFSA